MNTITRSLSAPGAPVGVGLVKKQAELASLQEQLDDFLKRLHGHRGLLADKCTELFGPECPKGESASAQEDSAGRIGALHDVIRYIRNTQEDIERLAGRLVSEL